ncbi:MAG: hypothetical protein PVI90_10340 [Desulfobacteraceae bacterium]|jgi:hypothetical protein
MKLLSLFLLCLILLLFTCSCSQSTSVKLVRKNTGYHNFTLDSRDYIGNKSIVGLRLYLSENTMIDLNIKTIADFIRPADIEQNKRLYPEEIEIQPWALCEISF